MSSGAVRVDLAWEDTVPWSKVRELLSKVLSPCDGAPVMVFDHSFYPSPGKLSFLMRMFLLTEYAMLFALHKGFNVPLRVAYFAEVDAYSKWQAFANKELLVFDCASKDGLYHYGIFYPDLLFIKSVGWLARQSMLEYSDENGLPKLNDMADGAVVYRDYIYSVNP